MRARMRGLAVAPTLVLLFLVFTGVASAAKIVVFEEPVGDAAGGAPDISGLRIINYVDGTLSFGARIVNRTNFASSDAYQIGLDIDRNRSTPPGGLDGGEYVFVFTGMFGLLRWDQERRRYEEIKPPLEWGWSLGPLVAVNMRDLGLAFGDTFDAVVVSSQSPTVRDVAPDRLNVRWTFRLERIPDCGLGGTQGDDVLEGSPGADYICGHRGDDKIRGFAGNDRLTGGGGRDRLAGGSGDDRLTGGAGADVLASGGAHDRISAGGGNDRIYARDNSRDTVRCGRGDDVVVSADAGDRLIGC